MKPGWNRHAIPDFDPEPILAEIRAQGWTFEAMARAAGLPHATLAHWRARTHRASRSALEAVLRALDDLTNYEPCPYCHGRGFLPKWLRSRTGRMRRAPS